MLTKFVFFAGVGTPLGELTALPQTLVGWGGEYPLSIPHSLDASF